MLDRAEMSPAFEMTHAYEQIKQSSDKLLSRLIQHHDYSVRLPEAVAPKFAADPENCLTDAEINAEELQIVTIQKIIAHQYGVLLSDILSSSSKIKAVLPRQIAMYLSRLLTTKSFPHIASEFNKADHSTVMHAVEKIKGRIVNDPTFAGRVSDLVSALKQARAAA